jgi:hypothetical protein
MPTCPATAKPSARSDDVNQTCKQIWNAAMGVGPCLAANAAAKVTQDVTAMTLVNIRKPAHQGLKKVNKSYKYPIASNTNVRFEVGMNKKALN